MMEATPILKQRTPLRNVWRIGLRLGHRAIKQERENMECYASTRVLTKLEVSLATQLIYNPAIATKFCNYL